MTDAHNHLHQLPDPLLAMRQSFEAGLSRMIVNGTCESDWPQVARLSSQQHDPTHHPQIIPAFGLHPWHVPDRTNHWLTSLETHLQQNPSAHLGECGLDRWKKPFDLSDQLQCLHEQISLANRLQRPLTIHCLQAWGPLLQLLESHPSLPPFLLHAYSGSAEMVPRFADLGAYFSFNAYFLHERKHKARETFRQIPRDRLLIESDAPSMLPPDTFRSHPLPNDQNHPANLPLALPPLAEIHALPPHELAENLENNFQTFAGIPTRRITA